MSTQKKQFGLFCAIILILFCISISQDVNNPNTLNNNIPQVSTDNTQQQQNNNNLQQTNSPSLNSSNSNANNNDVNNNNNNNGNNINNQQQNYNNQVGNQQPNNNQNQQINNNENLNNANINQQNNQNQQILNTQQVMKKAEEATQKANQVLASVNTNNNNQNQNTQKNNAEDLKQEQYTRNPNDSNKRQFGYQKSGVSKTNQIRIKQYERINSIQSSFTGQYKDYNFQLKTTEEFLIKVPIQQPFVLVSQVYIEQDNHYKQIQNVEKETQTRFTVIQNKQKLVADQRFYFQGGINFTANGGSKYGIKFFNSGRPKLISMQIRFITEDAHVAKILNSNDTQHFTPYINKITGQVEHAMNSFRRLWFYDYSRVKQTAQLAKLYYIYQIFQMLITGFVAFLQIKMINKLLKGNQSIV